MIIIKSEHEIEMMREAGKVTGQILREQKDVIMPGISTMDIDQYVERRVKDFGMIASEKGYCGFPGSVCTSVNEVVVHGIPSESCILNEGDIVSVDLVVEYKGYMADACRTYAVGEISPEAQHLIDTAEAAFFEGMKYAKVGNRLGDISNAIQQKVESEGFGVIREFVGHGIGKDMHEEPQIPNYGKAGKGPRLVKGMTLAIEPMIVEGSYEVDVLLDDWTVVTIDGGLAAHYENTVVISDGEPELLTL